MVTCVVYGEKARRVWGTQRGGSGAASGALASGALASGALASGASMSSPRLFLDTEARADSGVAGRGAHRERMSSFYSRAPPGSQERHVTR